MFISEDTHALLQQELALLHELRPGFADRIATAIREQRIYGSWYMLLDHPGCGCAYGQIEQCDVRRGFNLATEVRKKLGISDSGQTPMERLVIKVVPGETTDNLTYLLEQLQPYCTPKEDPMLLNELALIEQKAPGFAPRLIEAIEAGAIQGNMFVAVNRACGCAYGQIAELDENRAERLQRWVSDQLDEQYHYKCILTPIEKLVGCVEEGETQETNEELKTLYDALQVYTTHHA